MDKDKKIKQLEELVKELQEENDLLWNYLDEIRESEKALMREIQLAVDHYVTKQMKPIGDAQTIYLYGRGKYVLSKKEFVAVGDAVFLKKRKNMRPPRYSETPEQLGTGTIVEILTELFLYPHEKNIIFEYDSDLDPEYVSYKMKKERDKEVIKTSICKVYWHGVDRYRWEYETDLKKNPLDGKKEQDT